MRLTLDVNININPTQQSEAIKLLNELLNLNKAMAKNFTDLETQITNLTGKVDTLQESLNTEQQQIQDAIGVLTTANTEQTALIQQLRDELAALGVDQAKIDELVGKAEAVNAKLDEIKTDLEGTIANAPVEPPAEPQP